MINCIVLGAGLIGQQFVRMLSKHPYFNLVGIIASDSSSGTALESKWSLPNFDVPEEYSDMRLQTLDTLDTRSYDLVFSALPADLATDIEKDLAWKGKKIFSNASSYRYTSNVPILIPEINAEHIQVIKSQESYMEQNGFIVTNSNCTTSGLVLVLNELLKFQPIKNVFVSSYQALSGAGFDGINNIPRDRVIPFIEKEEEKIEIETRKILGILNELNTKIVDNSSIGQILANCARVPILDGHLEAITIEFNGETDLEIIKSHLIRAENPYKGLPTAPEQHIIVVEGKDRPQTALDLYNGTPEQARGMPINIGRLRMTNNRYLRFYALVHNTIRGGAGGSILNAELAYSRGML